MNASMTAQSTEVTLEASPTNLFFEEVLRLQSSGWSGPLRDPDTGEYLYMTGTRQIVGNVHDPRLCTGRHCVIHNPSFHSMFDLPTHWRNDRKIMERICPHGIGHPDPDDLEYLDLRYPVNAGYHGIHGCDGCCHEDH